MKRATVFSFSRRGQETAARVAEALAGTFSCTPSAPRGDLAPIVASAFETEAALIFIGACGIAVRAVAPLLAGKDRDPAVLAIDEAGRYVIPLVGGHIGGANRLAGRLADALNAQAVITTATDVAGRFPADEWAARNGLAIDDLEAAKRFSARILEEDLPVKTAFPIRGSLPPGLYAGDAGPCGLAITCRTHRPFDDTLLLIPRILHLGVGCKRGISQQAVERAVRIVTEGNHIHPLAIRRVASIDLKRSEAGLAAWADQRGLPLAFYPAEALNRLPGTFSASAFVKSAVGCDNVCERAAMASAGAGARLLVGKQIQDGVTVAVACEKWSVSFE